MESKYTEVGLGQAVGEGVLLWPEDPPLHLPGPAHPQHQRPAGAQPDKRGRGLQLQVGILDEAPRARYRKWTGPLESLGWGFKLGGPSTQWKVTPAVLLEGANATLATDNTFIEATCNRTSGGEIFKKMLLYVPPPAPK